MIKTISGSQFPKVVQPLIEQAKESIDIVIFDWRWYSADPASSIQLFNQTILRAVRRGVKVRVINNSQEIIAILKKNGIEAKRFECTKLMHVKLMIIDKNIVITGSHNYSQSAFNLNVELSVLITDDSCASDFNVFFNNLFNQQ